MKSSLLWTLPVAGSLLGSLVACNSSGLSGTVAPEPTTTQSVTVPVTTTPDQRLAANVKISKISIYQGVEVVLTVGGEAPTTIEAPVVVGRDAMLRVFLDPDQGFEARRLEAVLTIVNDQDVVYTARNRIEGRSTDADLESTLNIDIAGADIESGSEFIVEVVEVDEEAPGGGSKSDVKWRSQSQDGLDAEESDDLTIVLVPIRYNADGSGRLPDTSAAQVQRIEDLAKAVYPARSVTIRVDPPVDWDYPVDALNDNQWGNLLSAFNSFRDDADEAPNTYYYGMFNAEASINEYCRFGCILGLSLLAYSANDPYFRASIGVGYPGQSSADTLVHEVGHAHGRDHAPCGLNGADRDYPYPNAALGAWGYDPVDARLLDPDSYKDMMSYCSPIWVSDYTYSELLDRIQSVRNQPRSMRASRQAVSVFGDGTSTLSGRMNVSAGSGAPIALDLYDADGRHVGVGGGQFFPYDHIAGGRVALDQDLPEGWTAVAQALPAAH